MLVGLEGGGADLQGARRTVGLPPRPDGRRPRLSRPAVAAVRRAGGIQLGGPGMLPPAPALRNPGRRRRGSGRGGGEEPQGFGLAGEPAEVVARVPDGVAGGGGSRVPRERLRRAFQSGAWRTSAVQAAGSEPPSARAR